MTDYVQQYENPRFPYEKREADRLALDFDTSASVDAAGIVRWRSNGAIPPADVLEFWRHLGKVFDHDASQALRQSEQAAFLDQYRRINAGRQRSDEEMFELRAAFGEGAEVVDVITRDRVRC